MAHGDTRKRTAAALGPTLTDASAQPSCSPLRLPNAGCLCNVTATLALDMNHSLLAPSFPSSRHEPQLARSLLLILTWFSASPPRRLSQHFHGPLGVSSLRRISSPAPPWLSGERPCPLASLLSRSVLPLPTSPPAATLPTVTRLFPLSPDKPPFGSSCRPPFSPGLQNETPLTTLPSNPQTFPAQHRSQPHQHPHWRHSALTFCASVLH